MGTRTVRRERIGDVTDPRSIERRSEYERVIVEVVGRHVLRLLIIWKVSTWADAAGATRAWVFGMAQPTAKATINAAMLIPNNVLPSSSSPVHP